MRIFRSWVLGALMLMSVLVLVMGAREATLVDTAPLTAAEAVRVEALRANDDPIGRPLPLMAHWNVGAHTERPGFTPAYQLELIRQGHHLLPWFHMPAIGQTDQPTGSFAGWAYYDAPLREAARLHLPVSFVGTQWESVLTSDTKYFGLPAAKNPNAIGLDGKPLKMVSSRGPVAPWIEVGTLWTSSPLFQRIQDAYPDPPRVFFISNNEHAKVDYLNAEKDKHYLDLYGAGRDAAFRRNIFANGWITRYRALQGGMRKGVTKNLWRTQSTFIGYDAFGPSFYARWGGWEGYSLHIPGRISPSPLTWDGGSPSYYTNDWDPSTDYRVWSPQVESQNWVFMFDQALKLNPHFWFELSVWDGHTDDPAKDKRSFYAKQGQTASPARYGAMAQFGMWLLRPRAVREFRGWVEPRDDMQPYFLAMLNAVDRVHTNPVLRAFWRKGTLVPNRAHAHPYANSALAEYKNVDRWFLLDADVNPRWPWGLVTEIPVFSLALKVGDGRYRQWLVYAHAPLGKRKDVHITVPDFGDIIVDVPVAGAFYLVGAASVSLIGDSPARRERPVR